MDASSITTIGKQGLPVAPARKSVRGRKIKKRVSKTAKGVGGVGIFAAMITSAVESVRAGQQTSEDRQIADLDKRIREQNLEYVTSQNAKTKLPMLSFLTKREKPISKEEARSIMMAAAIGSASIATIGIGWFCYQKWDMLSAWCRPKMKQLGTRDTKLYADVKSQLDQLEADPDPDPDKLVEIVALRDKLLSIKNRVS